MKNLITIINKELRRFFTDKRMLAALLLPGILVFVLYSIMGDMMTNINADHIYTLRVENEPEGYHFFVGDDYKYIDDVDPADLGDLTPDEYYQQAVKNETLDLYVVFDVDWSERIAAADPLDKPEVIFYYNDGSIASTTLYSTFTGHISVMTQIYVLSPVTLSEKGDLTMTMLQGLLPFLLITFLFSGSMAVAPESIAGEKERGTIANLLITPVKRSTIALGKIIALSLVALVSATSSFLGIMFSLPKLMGTTISGSIYTIDIYLWLFLVLLSTILIFVMLISLISAYSKSIKEASSLATPLMLLLMAVGISSMFGAAAISNSLYLIPVFNSVNMLLMLFGGEVAAIPLILTLLSNFAVTALGVYVLTLLFSSEKVMFRK